MKNPIARLYNSSPNLAAIHEWFPLEQKNESNI